METGPRDVKKELSVAAATPAGVAAASAQDLSVPAAGRPDQAHPGADHQHPNAVAVVHPEAAACGC